MASKFCVLDENKICNDCGECDYCDLNPFKNVIIAENALTLMTNTEN